MRAPGIWENLRLIRFSNQLARDLGLHFNLTLSVAEFNFWLTIINRWTLA